MLTQLLINCICIPYHAGKDQIKVRATNMGSSIIFPIHGFGDGSAVKYMTDPKYKDVSCTSMSDGCRFVCFLISHHSSLGLCVELFYGQLFSLSLVLRLFLGIFHTFLIL